ncbi:hypothetical protein [Spirosoma panaciterrae]|uniref:hypothetical protein n=1 Tax=Spirosoma panaciterrae TaxID=496058 RepID=UPI0003762690|nr:hypothetical protein [Spirosoma panaciterrae]
MALLSPIILFVYNRPWHTEQTLRALQQNDLAGESTLYIYADGPKANADEENLKSIEDVRAIIHAKQWCKNVVVIESDQNKGLAESIKSGVTEVIQKHQKAIVMEDDLISSPAFLTYMNNALDFYEDRKSVFSISGYCLPPTKMPFPVDYTYDVFVSLRNSSWGWATWVDRWNQVDWEVKSYAEMQNNKFIQEAFNRGGDDVYEMLHLQQEGKLNIWSIQFTLAHFANHAISIVPTKSFINNIGLDGSGENSGTHLNLKHEVLNKKREYKFLNILYEDKRIVNIFYSAYCRKKRPLWQKIINRANLIVSLKPPFLIKGKIYN